MPVAILLVQHVVDQCALPPADTMAVQARLNQLRAATSLRETLASLPDRSRTRIAQVLSRTDTLAHYLYIYYTTKLPGAAAVGQTVYALDASGHPFLLPGGRVSGFDIRVGRPWANLVPASGLAGEMLETLTGTCFTVLAIGLGNDVPR
jgi:hypothetical protein